MLSMLLRVQSLSPFMKFLLTGGFSAGVNILSRLLFSLVMSFEISVIAAYLIGMTTAYILARLFVFEKSGQTVRAEYIRFALVSLVALAQVLIVSVGLVSWVFPYLEFDFYPELIAHTIGVLSPVLTSYYGHKHFSFKNKRS